MSDAGFLALVNGVRHENSADLFEDVSERLRHRGIATKLFHGHNPNVEELQGAAVCISNSSLPVETVASLPYCLCALRITRPQELRLAAKCGLQTMRWSRAVSRTHVRALLRLWAADEIILKRSFTYGGNGVEILTRADIAELSWHERQDVFCPRIHPVDGDLFKSELLDGKHLISWYVHLPPIRTDLVLGRIPHASHGEWGHREPYDFDDETMHRLIRLSRMCSDRGFGHISVDFMRAPDGQLKVIEVNTDSVATWWTRQFTDYRANYTDAIEQIWRKETNAY